MAVSCRTGPVRDRRVLDGPTLAELHAGRTAAGWPLERAIRTLAPIAEALAIAADSRHRPTAPSARTASS